ncbi:hypothetical protein AVEN_140759-1 [Araneus ventricosus]|uniref:Uncharacterized protein n=1 Tax=Araneus ventricosus TaxID=182803 RepID=A0A4Y2F230_ARAVE|nr:hypothetical protein AVEN_140759-1 [Araneus ventricosus]
MMSDSEINRMNRSFSHLVEFEESRRASVIRDGKASVSTHSFVFSNFGQEASPLDTGPGNPIFGPTDDFPSLRSDIIGTD